MDDLKEKLKREEGQTPEIAGLNWMMPGQLGFYCEGHPTVYSLGLAMGDRHSQYDLWHPNPLEDAQVFAGKTFVFVGVGNPPLDQAFEKVDPPQVVNYQEKGNPLNSWNLWVCRNYKGFASFESKQNPRRY